MNLLPLPISPADMLNKVAQTAMIYLPEAMDTDRASVMLVAIPGQESNLAHRWQVVDLAKPEKRGPARGLFQFELGTQASKGGVWGVYLHKSSRFWLAQACNTLKVPFEARAIWQALETNDVLAVVVARLLLFTDPKPLPSIHDEEGAWAYYLRTWRPGAYTNGSPAARAKLRAKWAGNHARACAAVRGE